MTDQSSVAAPQDRRAADARQPDLVRRLLGRRRAREMGVAIRPDPIKAGQGAATATVEVDGRAQYRLVDEGRPRPAQIVPLVDDPIGMDELSRRLASIDVFAEAALNELRLRAYVATGIESSEPSRLDRREVDAALAQLKRLDGEGLPHGEESLVELVMQLGSIQRQHDAMKGRAGTNLLFMITSLSTTEVRMIAHSKAVGMRAEIASGKGADVVILNELLD